MRLFTTEIITNVERAIEATGLSLNGVARLMPGNYETNRTWLIRFLRGYIGKPRVDRMQDLADTFGVPLETLVGDDYVGSHAGPKRKTI